MGASAWRRRAQASEPSITGIGLAVITWNEGLTRDSSIITEWLEARSESVSVAAVCQQESDTVVSTPDGWERVFQQQITGMTKPFQLMLANIYLTVFQRVGSPVLALAQREGYVRTSASGKGGIWVDIELSGPDGCSKIIVACAHLPTEPEYRTPTAIQLLENAAQWYGQQKPECGPDFGSFPPKECWSQLHSVILAGDLNYRLDEKLRTDEFFDLGLPVDVWLRNALNTRKWEEMLRLDTISQSGLLTPSVGFDCQSIDYPPTYKVKRYDGCNTSLEYCYIEHGADVPYKHGEIKMGWLDRICWLKRGSHITLISNEVMYEPTEGPSDHIPVEVVIDLHNLDPTCQFGAVRHDIFKCETLPTFNGTALDKHCIGRAMPSACFSLDLQTPWKCFDDEHAAEATDCEYTSTARGGLYDGGVSTRMIIAMRLL